MVVAHALSLVWKYIKFISIRLINLIRKWIPSGILLIVFYTFFLKCNRAHPTQRTHIKTTENNIELKA